MNVIEQVGNVALSTVLQDAWARGQKVAVHGWVYGLHDGLLKDLGVTMDRPPRPWSTVFAPRSSATRARARATGRPTPTDRAPMFPHRLTDSRGLRHRQALLDGFNRHYRLFRETSARGQAALRAGRLARPAAGAGASASSSTTSAWTRPWRGCAASSTPTRCPMDTWQQVKLHYIGLLTDHHQPELAETFFNSVTAKHPAPQLLPQRLHLRAAGDQHRVHRERRARRAAHLPRLLPDAGQPARDLVAHRRNFQLQRAVRGPGARRRRRGEAMRVRAGRLPAARQLPDPGAVAACSSATRAPTWWARSSTASHETPFALPILHGARRASWSSTPRCSARTSC